MEQQPNHHNIFELPQDELETTSQNIKSHKENLDQYAREMGTNHGNLLNYISKYSEGLREAVPDDTAGNYYTVGSLMAYGLIFHLSEKNHLDLPPDIKPADINSAEVWQENIQKLKELTKRRKHHQPTADMNIAGYLFRTNQLAVTQPGFYETGLSMVSRMMQLPKSHIRQLEEIDTANEALEQLAIEFEPDKFVLDTRVIERVKAYMGGFSEVILLLRSATDRVVAEAILQSD